MDLFVDLIDLTNCQPLSEYAERMEKRPRRKDECSVDIFYKDSAENHVGLLTLKRAEPGEDRFVIRPQRMGDSSPMHIIQNQDWEIPQAKIRKAIALESSIRPESLGEDFAFEEPYDDFFDAFVTFALFGDITQTDPKQFNAALSERTLRDLYRICGKYPERWNSLEKFLATWAEDPQLDVDEKARIRWVIDAGRIFIRLQEHFPERNKINGLEGALLTAGLFLMLPSYFWETFSQNPDLKLAAVSTARAASPTASREDFDFYARLSKNLESFVPELPAIKSNLILLARGNRLQGLLQKAQQEQWARLMAMDSPEAALREGLVLKYGKTPATLEATRMLTSVLSVVYEGVERRPHFFLDMDRLYQSIVKRWEDPVMSAAYRKDFLAAVSGLLLDQFFAQGRNIEIFIDGRFQERANFYPALRLSTERSAWSDLIQWTREQMDEKKVELPPPHVLLNKSGLITDGAVATLGGVGLLISETAMPTLRTGAASALGAGAGGALGNATCYLFDWSNQYFLCDIIGGILGGVGAGLLATFLSREDSMIPRPPPIQPPPPQPDSASRMPVDPFGP